MVSRRVFGVAVFACAFLGEAVWCQSVPPAQQAYLPRSENALATQRIIKSEQKKLTDAEKRKLRAVAELKKTAEALPGGDENAVMRIFIRGKIAQALRSEDPRFAAAQCKLALEGFTADDVDNSEIERVISPILMELFELDAPAAIAAVERLPKAETLLRQQLINRLGSKQPARAAQMLLTWADDSGYFPYNTAGQIMRNLPADDPLRSDLFERATTVFLQAPEKRFQGRDDFAALLKMEASHLPRQRVLSLIDTMLDAAKRMDESSQYMVSSYPGDQPQRFSSLYELRVAQMMPLLQKLDPDRAQVLQQEDARLPQLADAAQHGWFSVSQSGGGPAADQGGSAGNGAAQAGAMHWSRGASSAQMSSLIASDPKQALAAAMTASDDQKPQLLEQIISRTLRAQPSIAGDAAAQLIAFAERQVGEASDFDSRIEALHSVRMALLLPLRFHGVDDDRAAQICSGLLPLVHQLYARDTDGSFQNLSAKAYWPSTAADGALVQHCAEVSPEIGDGILEGVDDAAVKILLKVYRDMAIVGERIRYANEVSIRTKLENGGTSSFRTIF